MGSAFCRNPKITERDEEEMNSLMRSEKSIAARIRSREILSACGIDGMNYRIMKAAGKEDVSFVQLLIRADIRSGHVMTLWKRAGTIRVQKKGGREIIGHWPPISIPDWTLSISSFHLFAFPSDPSGQFENRYFRG
jgi:hypothetical protein